MISKLKGLVEHIGETWVDLDVQGVCYRLGCSSRTLAALPAPGEATILFTQMLVREDDISLLGFQSAEERTLFQLLTSVQGVGARVGLGLFSIGTPGDIIQAISAEDKAFICRGEGIGPKLAGRILNELKGKIEKAFGASLAPSSSSYEEDGEKRPFQSASAPQKTLHQDAVAALTSLGYRTTEASHAVDFVLKHEPECAKVQDLIRLALSKLSRS